jgi:hypothetical protein
MFTARLLRESTKVALRHANRLCDVLRAECRAQAVDKNRDRGKVAVEGEERLPAGLAAVESKEVVVGSCVVDLQEYFFKLTMDVFTEVAFGVDLGSVSRAAPHAFARAFDDVQAAANARFNNPFYRVARLFQLTTSERAISKGAKVLDAFAMEVIAAKRRDLSALAPAAGGAAGGDCHLGPDLLSRFLEDAATKEAQDTKEGLAAEVRKRYATPSHAFAHLNK